VFLRVGSWPYPQTLDWNGKACWEQTLKLITKIHKLLEVFSLIYGHGGKVIKLFIGDDILTKSSNVKIYINNICNLISLSSK
jgi:hypothetical protein